MKRIKLIAHYKTRHRARAVVTGSKARSVVITDRMHWAHNTTGITVFNRGTKRESGFLSNDGPR